MKSDLPPLSKLSSRLESSIHNIGIDLRGQCILTEAASGPYITTALLAALSGADQVKACTRDSRWGTSDEIKCMLVELARHFGVSDRIEVVNCSTVDMADDVDIVTNLGFVRPINRSLVRRLPKHAVIALMWEPWEFRAEDIDLQACNDYHIPIIATNENHPYLMTFQAVGILSLKLLFEQQCEVTGLDIVVVGSDPFGQACANVLRGVGAFVTLLDPLLGWPSDGAVFAFETADAVVLVEHRHFSELLGSSCSMLVDLISSRCITLIHICGVVDINYLTARGIKKYPAHAASPGFMTLTTAYVGIKPMLDLHAAGLHVGSIVARARRKGSSIEEALNMAVASNYGLKLPSSLSQNK